MTMPDTKIDIAEMRMPVVRLKRIKPCGSYNDAVMAAYGHEPVGQLYSDLTSLLDQLEQSQREVERLTGEVARLERSRDNIIQADIDERNRSRPDYERDGPQW